MEKCYAVIESARNSRSDYYEQLDAPSGVPTMIGRFFGGCTRTTVTPKDREPAEFLISLGNHVLFPSAPPLLDEAGDAWRDADDMINVLDTAVELRGQIQELFDPQSERSELLLAAGDCLKELLMLKISNELVRLRLTEYRPLFAPVRLDCQLATRDLIKTDVEIRTPELEYGRFGTHLVVPADPARRISENHIRRWSVAWEHQNKIEHKNLLERLDVSFVLMDEQMGKFTDDLREFIKAHLRIYWNTYAGKGMLDGSESLSLFEQRQARGHRNAAHIASAVITDTLPPPASPGCLAPVEYVPGCGIQ